MQWGARAIAATGVVVWATGSACGGGGSGGTTVFTAPPGFPQGYLPVALDAGSHGDVAFRGGGDLYIVAGTADVIAVSREDGSVGVFADDVGGSGTVLHAAVVASDGRLFVADDDGIVYAVGEDGAWSEWIDTAAGPISGLVVVPSGFGDFGGSLLAAAGSAGLVRITTGEEPTASDFATASSYVDAVFSDTTLFALDATDASLVTIDTSGDPSPFQGGFDTPVGLAADPTASELIVVDAGDATLYAVPLGGGPPVGRAPYSFEITPPSGIAYDGAGALAWVTSGSVVVRGSAVPRIDPDNANFGLAFAGPTAGFGDLELSREGRFLLVANDPDDPQLEDDAVGNFFFAVPRDASTVTTLASGVGEDGEALLSLAYDPYSDTSYIGTSLGNIYRRTPGASPELLVSASSNALLGLEWAPAGAGAFAERPLVATTEQGEVLAIDPASPIPTSFVPSPILGTSGEPARLSDLVFATTGTLYVVDNGSTVTPGDPRILRIDADGTVTDLGANPAQLGQPDGIEIDEGGARLLVAVSDEPSDQLLEVSLIDAAVSPLADLPLSVDDGYYPTGIVYDRLGTAIVRVGDAFTRLDAVSVFP